MPPPSSGGTHLVEMLNVLEGWDLKQFGANTAETQHRMIETMRRAYADRAKYMGDPDFVRVPMAALTSKAYAARLREGIDLARAAKSADIGAGQLREGDQTTHFSVMDRFGNAVATTTTINLSFGSCRAVAGAGFLLNNEMDDFAAKPGAPNAFGLIGDEANAIAPGKRPLSSMTPTIVLKDGAPYLVTGSPGGSTIITVVLQEVLNVLEFGMNLAEATAEPRIHHQWLPDVVRAERGVSPDTLRLLEARGFNVQKNADGSFQYTVLGNTNSVMRAGELYLGAADPRDGDGAAAGF